jgi:hypothetical protein
MQNKNPSVDKGIAAVLQLHKMMKLETRVLIAYPHIISKAELCQYFFHILRWGYLI